MSSATSERDADGAEHVAAPSATARVVTPAAPAQPRATLADVGRLAGVSAKTVSRVVLGSSNVTPETRERVLRAARTLRFRPNHLARDLRHGSVTNTVAFVIGDLTNPFYFAVAAGIERELAKHGLMMILASTEDDPESEKTVVETLLQQRVRALLMVPIASDQSYLEGERQLGTPVVCIDRPATNLIADSVVLANADGTAEAVRALTRLGHRRIAFVCSPAALYTHQERLRGYRQALAEVGVTDTSPWERLEEAHGPSAADSVADLLAMPNPPTAIVAGNNRASSGVLHALRAGSSALRGPGTGASSGVGGGLGVDGSPQLGSVSGTLPSASNSADSIAFIGFDDFELADAYGISVVAYDPADLGRTAAQLVVSRMDDLTGPRATSRSPPASSPAAPASSPPEPDNADLSHPWPFWVGGSHINDSTPTDPPARARSRRKG